MSYSGDALPGREVEYTITAVNQYGEEKSLTQRAATEQEALEKVGLGTGFSSEGFWQHRQTEVIDHAE